MIAFAATVATIVTTFNTRHFLGAFTALLSRDVRSCEGRFEQRFGFLLNSTGQTATTFLHAKTTML